jgi:microcin C transport system permease protein
MIERYIKNEMQIKQWRRFKKNRLAVLATIVVLLVTFVSLTAEIWANSKPVVMSYKGSLYFPALKQYHPTVFNESAESMIADYRRLNIEENGWAIWPPVQWDPYESNKVVEEYPSPPTSTNWLGTDEGGRDVMSRLLYGYRYSLAYAVLVWLITTFIAIALGGIMGYAGGMTDIIGQRVVEVISSVPFLFVLIMLVSVFKPGLFMLVVLTAFFGWIFMSSYVRGEFLRNRKKEFVEAARAMGASHSRIIFTHILPNSIGPVITFAPFIIATYITSLAGLDYLGLGLPPPTPSWGELLAQAQKYFSIAWWLAVFPSLALFFTLVLLSLIGDGVRDALDPR